MKATIRKATPNDIDSILVIENESFKNPFSKENLLYEISENPVSNFYILESEQKVIGFIDYWVTFDSATIDQIAIKKSERNKGFASFLLNSAINLLKESGEISFFTLEVRKSNEAAKALYKKFGFKEITIKSKYYDDGEDAIYMVMGLG